MTGYFLRWLLVIWACPCGWARHPPHRPGVYPAIRREAQTNPSVPHAGGLPKKMKQDPVVSVPRGVLLCTKKAARFRAAGQHLSTYSASLKSSQIWFRYFEGGTAGIQDCVMAISGVSHSFGITGSFELLLVISTYQHLLRCAVDGDGH